MTSVRVPPRPSLRRRRTWRSAPWLRRVEIAMGLVGVALLTVVAVTSLRASLYQSEQGRVLSMMEDAAREDANRRPSVLLADSSLPAEIPASTPSPAAGNDASVLGRIEIPRIGVSAIVREGDDRAALAVAVGHVPGTARPGEAGNMALAGHRDSFFRPLERIRLLDVIDFQSADRRDRYRVESITVVEPHHVGVLDPSDRPVLTLITCYPFSWIGPAPKRFVVRAAKVEGSSDR